jgi:hypothetical protein
VTKRGKLEKDRKRVENRVDMKRSLRREVGKGER